MNCNRWNSVVRSHKTNNINEGTNNKIKFSKICKNRTHFDCGTRFNDDISYHSVDLDASSSEPDLDNCFLSKYCKSNKTGSVNKISLRSEQVKSVPCIHSDYDIGVNKGEKKPETQKRRFKSKFCLQHFDHGIDYVPIKLISSELDLKLNDKMNKSRQNYVSPKLTERKVNSWGRILKEQNVKDLKKPVEVVQQVSRIQRAAGLGTKSQTQSNIKGKEKTVSYEAKQRKTGYGEPKEKTESYESCTQQKNMKGLVSKRPSNVSIDSDPRGYRSTSKKSSRNIRTESGHRECDYSDSSSTITGESIMLVDRSAQCSETNLEISSPGLHRNVDDINQAGDNGLAFLNPVRTLNFLVRELRGKLNEGSEDENMLRIIRDMETTVSRLSKTSPQYTKDNWNTIISEEDLKCVLDILQSMPCKTKFVMEAEKSTVELQSKLEETCNRLEEMCKQMEKTTCSKLREEKQMLINELKEMKSELEVSRNKISEQEQMIAELKKKNDEQLKSIVTLKDSQTKSSALNAIINEQLEDTEKKYRQLVTEMQFLMLEKEKNLVLMKCKDQDLTDMRKNLEEIKTLVIQHLSTIHLESTDSGVTLPAKCPNIDFNDLSPVSAVSLATIQNNEDKPNSPEVAKCSSPVEKLSPQPEDDESWRKISDVPTNSEAQMTASEQKKAMKSICLKESLKNLFDEMKKQAHFGKHLPIQNFLNLDDPCGVSNWSDVDISDDDIRSAKFTISDTETNFQDRF